MENARLHATPDHVPNQEMLPVAQYLANFGLYLTSACGDKRLYARLSGPTFPLDKALNAAGAQWDDEEQVWTLGSQQVLRDFVDALERERGGARNELAEEASPFTCDHKLETPLDRLLALGPNALGNKDLLELLLSFDSYLADPKTASHRLFDEFGSLGAVLAGETGRLAQFDDVTPRVRGLLKAVQLTIERVLHEPVQENPIIGSWQALLDYLRGRLQHRRREELIVLYLDKKNRLIKTDDTQGSIDHVTLYPRDVAAKALELFASAVIIAHNHPGGDTKPSRGDLEMTQRLKSALAAIEIELYDHVIVSDRSDFSFRSESLI